MTVLPEGQKPSAHQPAKLETFWTKPLIRSSTIRSNRLSFCHFGIVLFAVLFSGVGARAQTPSPSPTPTPSLEKDFFKNILRDQKAIWTSPAHVHGHDAP